MLQVLNTALVGLGGWGWIIGITSMLIVSLALVIPVSKTRLWLKLSPCKYTCRTTLAHSTDTHASEGKSISKILARTAAICTYQNIPMPVINKRNCPLIFENLCEENRRVSRGVYWLPNLDSDRIC